MRRLTPSFSSASRAQAPHSQISGRSFLESSRKQRTSSSTLNNLNSDTSLPPPPLQIWLIVPYPLGVRALLAESGRQVSTRSMELMAFGYRSIPKLTGMWPLVPPTEKSPLRCFELYHSQCISVFLISPDIPKYPLLKLARPDVFPYFLTL